MEQSSFYDETTVRHQFDRKCKLALDDEVVDYDRHMDYRRKHEILFSELSECQTGKLSVVDEYNETSYFFKTCEYDFSNFLSKSDLKKVPRGTANVSEVATMLK